MSMMLNNYRQLKHLEQRGKKLPCTDAGYILIGSFLQLQQGHCVFNKNKAKHRIPSPELYVPQFTTSG